MLYGESRLRLEVCYENVLYKFTFDTDIDKGLRRERERERGNEN